METLLETPMEIQGAELDVTDYAYFHKNVNTGSLIVHDNADLFGDLSLAGHSVLWFGIRVILILQ